MEADWSVEIGKDLPVIEIPWEGFVDIRMNPRDIFAIPEAADNVVLRDALLLLNAESSPLLTSKCDTWMLGQDDIDPYEYDSSAENAQGGVACYVDLARRADFFASFEAHERWVRRSVTALREKVLLQSRAEYVIRAAEINNRNGFGVTLYVSACGKNTSEARIIFQTALKDAIAVTIKQQPLWASSSIG